MSETSNEQVVLEGGTYEILRRRLQEHGGRLQQAINSLNEDRRATFGSIKPQLLATQRITTDNNCTPRDIVAIAGEKFLFGYNVTFGLKSTTELADVFSVYTLKNQQFEQHDLALITDAEFQADFANLYKFYKNTIFTRFFTSGVYLYMVFRIGRSVTDIKTFKWLVRPDGTLQYQGNRSDHEYQYPPQQEFQWIRTTRDSFRQGRHPHVSIKDRVFVETVGGDLTIKIEDNTEDGQGVYSEDVVHKEQKLDDADIQFAELGPLILLRIKPYKEDKYRYFVFNEKIHQAVRIDSIGDSCILLPDDHGLIFPSGYYLVSGEYKTFPYDAAQMLFERRIISPNGEDSLFVFHHRERGNYVLLSYNLIERSVQTPIQCNGATFFRQGELLYFRAEAEPQKHHVVQIWQTPYVSSDYKPPIVEGSLLAQIGNRDLVRVMAECQNISHLVQRDESYQNLYDDIFKFTTVLLDSYFWLDKPEAHGLGPILGDVRQAASAAIDEFEKVRQIRRATAERVRDLEAQTRKLIATHKPDLMTRTDEFIGALAGLRALRGHIIGLRELRYVDKANVDALEQSVIARIGELSTGCVEFLLKPEALDPYEAKVLDVGRRTAELTKAIDAAAIEEDVARISHEVETMIDVVGNLRIDDATKTTQIIDGCSTILTSLNTVRADIRNRRKALQSREAVAEFTAQIKLLEQSVVSQLDIATTPERCEEYQNRLLVQVEELEGRFADFDEYVIALSDKRAEISSAFEARKLGLLEEKNRRIDGLAKSADRILKAIVGRVESMKEISAINAYFAGDLMVDRVRNTVAQLVELGDTVKSDEIESRLKSAQENAVRQLKDRQELFAEGENLIRFGKHRFSVSRQAPDLTYIVRDGKMYIHITGTNFFEEVNDEVLNASRAYWSQEYVSETPRVYRGEYLAHSILTKAGTEGLPTVRDMALMPSESIQEVVQTYMGPRFDEGYQKGVHDLDATAILRVLVHLYGEADLLRFDARVRSLARLYWHRALDDAARARLRTLVAGMGRAVSAFGDRPEFDVARARLRDGIAAFNQTTCLYTHDLAEDAAAYLFQELALRPDFIVSAEAARLLDAFVLYLRGAHQLPDLEATVGSLGHDPAGAMQLLRGWLAGYLAANPDPHLALFIDEAAALFIAGKFDRGCIHGAEVITELTGLKGSHARMPDGGLTIDFPEFMTRLSTHARHDVPGYRRYLARRKELAAQFARELKLNEFQPKVLTSFVRNRLINEVYLPLVGDNLAKQIGAAGAEKRTDLMGMLLLISPPGYGKTTLMEYIASRLGVIFVKINGPALGHNVVSLDPQEAPNAASREEVIKLNLALEMGDNIMIYLDDIQHCNPEFLQKFISLCDGQRRIEGVWRGRSRTYDLRGRKVAIVMAGNPYTETGDKFRIPDMLANRADTYNLGDILGDYKDAFEVSYLENSLTSNPILSPLATKPQADLHTLIRLARGGPQTEASFEAAYAASEVNDYVNVLKKLLGVQSTILRVNMEYIRSAAQEDAYRTEPPFKLQGSYRNMNKLAEKVLPIMNDGEVTRLVLSHYEGESQTLTTGAESNMLKFKDMTNQLSKVEAARWQEIKDTFARRQTMLGMDESDIMSRAVVQLSTLSEGVGAINRQLAPLDRLSTQLDGMAPQAATAMRELMAALREGIAAPAAAAVAAVAPPPPITFPESLKTEVPRQLIESMAGIAREVAAARHAMTRPPGAGEPVTRVDFSDEAMGRFARALAEVRIQASFPDLEGLLSPPGDKNPTERPFRGEFVAVGSMREALEANGYEVEELEPRVFAMRRDKNLPVIVRVRNDRLDIRVTVPVPDRRFDDPVFIQRLLRLNTEILPVGFAIETNEQGQRQLLLVESRDGRNLTRAELVRVLEFMEKAVGLTRELGI